MTVLNVTKKLTVFSSEYSSKPYSPLKEKIQLLIVQLRMFSAVIIQNYDTFILSVKH